MAGLALASQGLLPDKAISSEVRPEKGKLERSSYENGSVESLFFSLKRDPDWVKNENLKSILTVKQGIDMKKIAQDCQILYLAETHDDVASKQLIKEKIKELAQLGYSHVAFETLAEDQEGQFIEKTYSQSSKDPNARQKGYQLENPKRYDLFLNSMGKCWTDTKYYGEIADEAVRHGMKIVGIGYTDTYHKQMGRHDQIGDKIRTILEKEPNARVAVLLGKNHCFYDSQQIGPEGQGLESATFPGQLNHHFPGIKQKNVYLLEPEFFKEHQGEQYMATVPDTFNGQRLNAAEKGFDFLINAHQ